MAKESENEKREKVVEVSPGGGLCLTVIAPLIVFGLAYLLYPLMMHESIFGSEINFANCLVERIDPKTG